MQKACQKALVNHLLRIFSIFLIKVAVRQQILNLPKLLRNSWKVNGLQVLQIGVGKGGRTGRSIMNGLIFLSFWKSEEIKIAQKHTKNKGKGKAKEEKYHSLPKPFFILFRPGFQRFLHLHPRCLYPRFLRLHPRCLYPRFLRLRPRCLCPHFLRLRPRCLCPHFFRSQLQCCFLRFLP